MRQVIVSSCSVPIFGVKFVYNYGHQGESNDIIQKGLKVGGGGGEGGSYLI
jgi:hypothetical protein